jgi:hypothetical protein
VEHCQRLKAMAKHDVDSHLRAYKVTVDRPNVQMEDNCLPSRESPCTTPNLFGEAYKTKNTANHNRQPSELRPLRLNVNNPLTGTKTGINSLPELMTPRQMLITGMRATFDAPIYRNVVPQGSISQVGMFSKYAGPGRLTPVADKSQLDRTDQITLDKIEEMYTRVEHFSDQTAVLKHSGMKLPIPGYSGGNTWEVFQHYLLNLLDYFEMHHIIEDELDFMRLIILSHSLKDDAEEWYQQTVQLTMSDQPWTFEDTIMVLKQCFVVKAST